jgi:hypothetical protein
MSNLATTHEITAKSSIILKAVCLSAEQILFLEPKASLYKPRQSCKNACRFIKLK